MATESPMMSTECSPSGRSNGIASNGTTRSREEAEEALKSTTCIANGASGTNGVTAPQDLSFDSIEDTIQAFGTNRFPQSYTPSAPLNLLTKALHRSRLLHHCPRRPDTRK